MLIEGKKESDQFKVRGRGLKSRGFVINWDFQLKTKNLLN